MDREKNFYMRDEMQLSGTDAGELMRLCGIMDTNTNVRRFDFAGCQILHYLNQAGGKAYFLNLCPGDQTKIILKRNGEPVMNMPDTGSLSIRKMELAGVAPMLEDLETNKTVFLFYQGDRLGMDLVFSSHALRKTMGVRLPVTDTVPSVERDMLLAKKIGDLNIPMNYYTVLRSAGNYHLAVGMFTRAPKREAWTEVTEFALKTGPVETLSWRMTQKAGLEIRIQYKEESDAIRSAYPECRFVPCHIFRTCDSGHTSDSISWGWQDPEDDEAWFISGEAKVDNGSWERAFSKCLAGHVDEAGKIQGDLGKDCQTKEDMVGYMLSKLQKNGARSAAGVRPINRLIQYISEHFHEGISQKEILELSMRAIHEEVFFDVSHYADRIMRERVVGSLLN